MYLTPAQKQGYVRSQGNFKIAGATGLLTAADLREAPTAEELEIIVALLMAEDAA